MLLSILIRYIHSYVEKREKNKLRYFISINVKFIFCLSQRCPAQEWGINSPGPCWLRITWELHESTRPPEISMTQPLSSALTPMPWSRGAPIELALMSDRTGFKLQLCHLWTGWPWASALTFLTILSKFFWDLKRSHEPVIFPSLKGCAFERVSKDSFLGVKNLCTI